jgi:hypothetical protein
MTHSILATWQMTATSLFSYTSFMVALWGEFQNRAIIEESLLLCYAGDLSVYGMSDFLWLLCP